MFLQKSCLRKDCVYNPSAESLQESYLRPNAERLCFQNPTGGTGGTCAGQALALESCTSLLPEGLCLGGVFLTCYMVILKVAVYTVIIWIFLKEKGVA